MKKYLIIIFLGIVSSYNTYSQTDTRVSEIKDTPYVALKKYNGDTLGYVQQNFIDNKSKYIGKELNILLSDLEIPVKSCLISSSTRNVKDMPETYLQFYSPTESTKRRYSKHRPVDIIIIWSQPLPIDSGIFLIKKNKLVWTEEERKYFGKQIIGDILTTKWGN